MELFENAREKTTSPLLLQSYASEFRQGSLHHAKKRKETLTLHLRAG